MRGEKGPKIMATSKKLDVSANPLPISFKDFSKNPVVGTMFLVIIGISVLYIDIRGTFNNQIEGQGRKIEKLETKNLKDEVSSP